MVPVIHTPFSSTLSAVYVYAPEYEQCSQCADEKSIRHPAVNTGDGKQTFACVDQEDFNYWCVNLINTSKSLSVNSNNFEL